MIVCKLFHSGWLLFRCKLQLKSIIMWSKLENWDISHWKPKFLRLTSREKSAILRMPSNLRIVHQTTVFMIHDYCQLVNSIVRLSYKISSEYVVWVYYYVMSYTVLFRSLTEVLNVLDATSTYTSSITTSHASFLNDCSKLSQHSVWYAEIVRAVKKCQVAWLPSHQNTIHLHFFNSSTDIPKCTCLPHPSSHKFKPHIPFFIIKTDIPLCISSNLDAIPINAT